MSSIASSTYQPRIPPRILCPEREDPSDHWTERLATAVQCIGVVNTSGLRRRRLSRIVQLAERYQTELARAGEQDLARFTRDLRLELRQDHERAATVARAFALVREISGRELGMRHFDVQLIGGFALLTGVIAEMETGEGKTLTATLPACTAALSGVPVHIVTVNDYLARRDAEWMGPIYRALGLTVGVVVHGMTPDERRAAYRCDVTYCTNKEVAFDYLRDRVVLGSDTSNLRLKLERHYGGDARAEKLVMRGLHFAIVDEADSILIDEARTPLIISGQADAENDKRMVAQAVELVAPLEIGTDYRVLKDERQVELTSRGRERLRESGEAMGGLWRGTVFRGEMATHALAARHLFVRDEHYLVRDGEVQIIDEYTGRVMEDRFWSEGLHQLIEAKEGCEITGRKTTFARMTYQRFFRRYQRLAGMTGTARQVAGEFWTVYRLPVARIPTNRPMRRVDLPDRVCDTADEKWRTITARVAELHRAGIPVLLGTRSVAASDVASQHLKQANIEHRVLNAAQDEDEAEIIAEAGGLGRITIATNMAGRGTDIKLAPGVTALGGLHVIMSERHDAGRIDRQLAGRCGRQGEPGRVEPILSLEDPLLEVIGGGRLASLVKLLSRPAARTTVASVLFRFAQIKADRVHARTRKELLKMDRQLGRLLAFSGRME